MTSAFLGFLSGLVLRKDDYANLSVRFNRQSSFFSSYMLQPEPPESSCPINVLMDIISAKWTTEIMRELALQATRTRKFLLHIPGLSMKTLSRRLQSLESAGLINRREFEGKPIKVEYSLTQNGVKLCSILEQIKQLEVELNVNCLKCKCSIEKACLAQPDQLACPHRRIKRMRGSS